MCSRPFYGIAQHFSSTMALCQLKLCGRVKAHVIDFPEFNDPGWLCDLAFLMDIISQLQGKDILMPDMVSPITAFEVKLRLWESQMMKSDFTHFKRLRACSPEDVSVHVGIVTQLREEFSARFSDLRDTRTISSSSLRLLMWMWSLPRQKYRWSSLICSAPMN